MSKTLAILFFGHLRTYEQTYPFFLKNVLAPNLKDGWKIDIFMHVWDELSSDKGSYYEKQNHILKINAALNGKSLSTKDKENILSFYAPKAHLITERKSEFNQNTSREEVAKLCAEYEKEKGVKYDYYAFTRPDILFYTPFKFDDYLSEYKKWWRLGQESLPPKHTFYANGVFRRSKIIDFRDINEGDLFYISSYLMIDPFKVFNECYPILLDYRLNRQFFIWRAGDKLAYINPIINIKWSNCVKFAFTPRALKIRFHENIKKLSNFFKKRLLRQQA